MKARVEFSPSLFELDDKQVVTLYGQTKKGIFDVIYALEKCEHCVVTNVFFTDEVKDNSNVVQGRPEYETS